MHTKEKWTGSHGQIMGEGIGIADVKNRNEEGNLRRIVACVNACKGISTEAIEGGVIKELLEALKAIQEENENFSFETEYDGQMFSLCLFCKGQDGKHDKDCIKKQTEQAINKAHAKAEKGAE